MAMTRGDMKDEIRANHGSTSSTWKDSVLNTIFTLMLEDLSAKHKWKDLQEINSDNTLAEDAYYVTLPTDVEYVEGDIHLLDSNSDWYTVKLRGLTDFRELDEDRGRPTPPSTSALPEYATLIGRVLYFDAYANDDFTVYMDAYKYPTVMSADSEYPDITNIDGVLIAYGTALLYTHRKMQEAAAPWFELADYFLKQKYRKESGGKIKLNRSPMGI